MYEFYKDILSMTDAHPKVPCITLEDMHVHFYSKHINYGKEVLRKNVAANGLKVKAYKAK